jgi:arsenate reductase
MSAHWGVEDPAAVEGCDEEKRRAFKLAFSVLSARINLLLSLPVDRLDRMSLQARLREIGKSGQETKV